MGTVLLLIIILNSSNEFALRKDMPFAIEAAKEHVDRSVREIERRARLKEMDTGSINRSDLEYGTPIPELFANSDDVLECNSADDIFQSGAIVFYNVPVIWNGEIWHFVMVKVNRLLLGTGYGYYGMITDRGGTGLEGLVRLQHKYAQLDSSIVLEVNIHEIPTEVWIKMGTHYRVILANSYDSEKDDWANAVNVDELLPEWKRYIRQERNRNRRNLRRTH